jgi:hypothetical protein
MTLRFSWDYAPLRTQVFWNQNSEEYAGETSEYSTGTILHSKIAILPDNTIVTLTN